MNLIPIAATMLLSKSIFLFKAHFKVCIKGYRIIYVWKEKIRRCLVLSDNLLMMDINYTKTNMVEVMVCTITIL